MKQILLRAITRALNISKRGLVVRESLVKCYLRRVGVVVDNIVLRRDEGEGEARVEREIDLVNARHKQLVTLCSCLQVEELFRNGINLRRLGAKPRVVARPSGME